MPITIAILAPGEMGAAVGARLVAAGARVTTSLAGRSHSRHMLKGRHEFAAGVNGSSTISLQAA